MNGASNTSRRTAAVALMSLLTHQTMYRDPETRARARRRMSEMREGTDLRDEHWEVVRVDGESRVLGISTSLLTTNDGLTHALESRVYTSSESSDLDLPGFDFHRLRGHRVSRYSIHVNGPWCITFCFRDGEASAVDLEQYH